MLYKKIHIVKPGQSIVIYVFLSMIVYFHHKDMYDWLFKILVIVYIQFITYIIILYLDYILTIFLPIKTIYEIPSLNKIAI